MEKVRYIIVLICFPLYIPYLLCYLLSKNRDLIKSDIKPMNMDQRYGNILSLVYNLKYDSYFHTVFMHRIKDLKLRHILPSKNCNNFYIPYDVEIGESISYAHPYSTIINAKKIGRNFSFKHLTTIGNKGDDESLRPTILDNVTIGANVTIIGDITIGNNVIIGAGCVVTKSIPDNSIVVGNPMKYIVKNGYTEKAN